MNMTGIIDTHAHYDDEAFEEDRDALLWGMKDAGVTAIVNAGDADREGEIIVRTCV